MKNGKTSVMIMSVCLILASCLCFAQTAEELLPEAIRLEEVKGELEKAIEIYQTIIKKFPGNKPVAAKAQLHIGLCYEKLGKAEALKAYESVVRDYSDQAECAKVARERLNALTEEGSGTKGRTDVVLRRILKTEDGYNPIAGISRDGRYIVLNKNGDLWLHDCQTERQKQISSEASRAKWSFAYGNASAYISPDGKWIVHTWQRGAYGELRLSSVDGSSMRILHNGKDEKGRMVPLDWMPDGQRILAASFDMKDRTYQLYLISLADSTFHKIGHPSRQESTVWTLARPSPDGRYVASCKEGDIYIFNTLTEEESVVIQNPAQDALTGWTPDGSGIVFLSNRSGSYDLFLQGFDDGRPVGDLKLLRRDFGDNGGFFITSEGKLYRIEQMGYGTSFTIAADRQSGKPLGIPSPVDPDYPGVEGPLWSSDGKLLYYEIYINKNNEQLLFIRSEETGQKHEVILKPKLKFWYRPLLSPDGRQFIVTGNSGEVNSNFGVFMINAETGDVKQVVKITSTPSGEVIDPCQNWSPDGKAIYYKVRSPEKSEEFIIRCKDLLTGEDTEIYRGLHTIGMKISPDGTRFAYKRSDKVDKSFVIGILDIKTGKELELGRFKESEGPESCTWTPDGKYILVDKNPGKGSELWRFPANGGPGEMIHSFPEGGYGFVLNPGGDKMAFTRYQVNFELWVLENFLPE